MAIAKKKKRFHEVELPLIGKTTSLYDFSVENLNGKIIKYDLTRSLRGKSSTLNAQVVVSEGKATTIPKKFQILKYYIKRMVRKGTSYVEDSFSTELKDNQVRVKPFLVTRRKVPRSVRKALREKAREELIKELSKKTTEEAFQDILSNKLQKELSLTLKKIYPLSSCEIRIFKVEEKSE